MKLVVLRTYFYASAIAHSAFRDQSWRRRPRPNLQVPPTGVLTPQQPQRTTSRDVTIERHLPWDARSVRGKGLTKERLRGIDSTVTAQQKIYRLAVLVNGSVKIVPLGFDRYVRLIDPPRRADESREPVPTLLELRDVPRHPSKYRRVRDLQPRSAIISGAPSGSRARLAVRRV